jgi:hypothetical protein
VPPAGREIQRRSSHANGSHTSIDENFSTTEILGRGLLSLNPSKWVVRLSIRASQLDQLDQSPAPNNAQCSCTDLHYCGPDGLRDSVWAVLFGHPPIARWTPPQIKFGACLSRLEYHVCLTYLHLRRENQKCAPVQINTAFALTLHPRACNCRALPRLASSLYN